MNRLTNLIAICLLVSSVGFAQELGFHYGRENEGSGSNGWVTNNYGLDFTLSAGNTRFHGNLSYLMYSESIYSVYDSSYIKNEAWGVSLEFLWDVVYIDPEELPISGYFGVGSNIRYMKDWWFPDAGVVAEIGLEYKFKHFPITAGVDWRPAYLIIDSEAELSRFGLNVKYRFGS